jgi:molybdopterin synthase catalytic subunit
VVNAEALIEAIEHHPDRDRIGMILTHIGIVRGFSRNGRQVSMIEMRVNDSKIDGIIQKHRQMPGIVEIRVALANKARLVPGERIMAVAVAGDVRENVLGAMASIIDAIKAEVTHKVEHYA